LYTPSVPRGALCFLMRLASYLSKKNQQIF